MDKPNVKVGVGVGVGSIVWMVALILDKTLGIELTIKDYGMLTTAIYFAFQYLVPEPS